jgi:hypothetical protein
MLRYIEDRNTPIHRKNIKGCTIQNHRKGTIKSSERYFFIRGSKVVVDPLLYTLIQNLSTDETQPARDYELFLIWSHNAPVCKCPICGPNHCDTLLSWNCEFLVKELSTPTLFHCVQIGHEHQMTSTIKPPADPLSVPDFEPTPRWIVL